MISVFPRPPSRPMTMPNRCGPSLRSPLERASRCVSRRADLPALDLTEADRRHRTGEVAGVSLACRGEGALDASGTVLCVRTRVEASLQKEGLDCFDLSGPLQQAAQEADQQTGDMLFWYDDTHWNERGHQVVADIIASQVLSSR